MNTPTPKFLSATAMVDEAATRPMPKSRGIDVQYSVTTSAGIVDRARAELLLSCVVIGGITTHNVAQEIGVAVHELAGLFT
ncbi:hypothetical protein [Massilia niabensis]|uniref:Uncharacterized protein n=1 Tax=Massilia niabensis TaxID=544910 RepID=A0ABW0L2G3_9BURK